MKQIGRYIVKGLLGRGGTAKVFKVELAPIGKIGALKLFAPDPVLVNLMGFGHLKDLFVSEALTLSRLQHPNIIRIHDFDEYKGSPFFVMDFAANNLGVLMGETYRVEQPSRIINVEKVLHYTRQTLEGLGCLHDAGIIHRDIKPFNLLVNAQDQIKICDFGLSKLRGETYRGPDNLNVGSPYYAAPEQEAHPDQVAVNADIYPVGIMLYRMLTGQLPRTSPMDPTYQPPSALNTVLDAVWDQFVADAIHPQPEERFGNAIIMRQVLRELTEHWTQQREKTCALLPDEAPSTIPSPVPDAPFVRQIPIRTNPGNACRQFKIDPLWRPITYVSNNFKSLPDNLVLDHTTGLVWQRAGSDYPRIWQDAHAYVEQLNATKRGGFERWRLPTIEELMTLLRPQAVGRDFCIVPLFDATQRWLWSADRRSFVAAYYADIEMGFVGWQDFSAPFYVRGVCSIRE